MFKNIIYTIVLILITFTSCKTTKEMMDDFNYFEKNGDSLTSIIKVLKEPVIQISDQLSIVVSSASLNQEQAAVFNLLNSSNSGGGGGLALMTQGYLVDFDGNIRLPVIGNVKAAGLTKSTLNDSLVARISPYVKDPVINIRFLNFTVNVLGEVSSKGPVRISNEKATLIDVISLAGGLTNQGKSNNIMVFRNLPNGSFTVDTLNINDARVFGSNYYQLQQNDLVYVSPNKNKLRQISTNPLIYRDIPFFLSLTSAVFLFLNLIIK